MKAPLTSDTMKEYLLRIKEVTDNTDPTPELEQASQNITNFVNNIDDANDEETYLYEEMLID